MYIDIGRDEPKGITSCKPRRAIGKIHNSTLRVSSRRSRADTIPATSLFSARLLESASPDEVVVSLAEIDVGDKYINAQYEVVSRCLPRPFSSRVPRTAGTLEYYIVYMVVLPNADVRGASRRLRETRVD